MSKKNIPVLLIVNLEISRNSLIFIFPLAGCWPDISECNWLVPWKIELKCPNTALGSAISSFPEPNTFLSGTAPHPRFFQGIISHVRGFLGYGQEMTGCDTELAIH